MPIENIKPNYGIYLGKVMQHLSHGLLKVYIYGIYPEEFQYMPERLPTCTQIAPQFGGSYNGNGVFSYPNIGATVACCFANGDQNLPIMLGAIQGGENAFGQYEWTKNLGEAVSERHLVTAGKSHVELYENGKISAVVADPIRTEAKVLYDTTPEAQLSIDDVYDRPIFDKAVKDEISNIACELVMDNNEANGAISCSTHYYKPMSDQFVLSDEQFMTMSTLIGVDKYDTKTRVDNAGARHYSNASSLNSTVSETTVSSDGGLSQLVHPSKLTVDIDHTNGIDGDYKNEMLSSVFDSQTLIINNAEGKQVSTYNTTLTGACIMEQKVPLDFTLSNMFKQQQISGYVNTDTKENKYFNKKDNVDVYMQAYDDTHIEIASSKSGKLLETDVQGEVKMHKDNYNASATSELDANTGFSLQSEYNDKDQKQTADSAIVVKKNNKASVKAEVNPNAKIVLKAREKYYKQIDTAVGKQDVECVTQMLPAEGVLEMNIVNNLGNTLCELRFTDGGLATLHATTQIDIIAPTVNITGTTLNQQFKTSNQTADTMNITGKNGDCVIKNVSLLNHLHMETQSGDVVAPQPSKTATASN